MKRLILVVLFIGGLALGQDKPRVFVQGRGSKGSERYDQLRLRRRRKALGSLELEVDRCLAR
jgi:hypothetical protein